MPIGAFRLNTISKLIAEATVIYARTAKTVTAFGNAQVSTAQSKFGGASALFDGTGDYLTAGTSGDYTFGTGNFTVECWFRYSSLASFATICDLRFNASSDTAAIYFDSGVMKVHTNNGVRITSGTTFSANTWYHVALSRSGTSLKLFLDGQQQGSTYTDSTNYSSSNKLNIGVNYDLNGVTYWNGYIDEFRISNSARYTSNFTPPSQAFVNDVNTTLLIHGNGVNASTTFTDDNFSHRRAVNVFGDAQVSTAQSKFGGASLLFDGTGDYLAVPYNASFAYGTGDFTIEFWIRFNALSTVDNKIIWDQRPLESSGGAHPTIYATTTQNFAYFTNGANRCLGTTTAVINTWYHIAVSRTAGSTRLFVNGTQEGDTYSDSTDYLTNTTELRIARSVFASFPDSVNGYYDEIRVSNNSRYSTTFTPATAQFDLDANTTLLIHGDGANTSTDIKYELYAPPAVGHQSRSIVPYGEAQISTAQSKFGGSSVLLDGTSDSLIITPNIIFGSSNFTIEGWIRYYNSPTLDTIFNNRNSVGAIDNGAIDLGHFSSTLYMSMRNDAATLYQFTGTALTTNTWIHIAIVRNGDNITVYKDGTSAITGSISGSFSYNNSLIIGNYRDGTTQAADAYFDEVRVSNIARYTTTFTPSTTAFQADANTLLLLHCDGANGSTKFVDDGSNSVVLDDVVVHASNTSTASTITIPASAAIGDYAVLFDTSTTTTDTTPSNWTSLNKATTTGIRTNISYKKLVSGDPGSTVTGMAGTTRKVMLIIKGNSDITSVTVSTPGSQATTATPTNQTISSGVNTPTVFFAAYASTGSITTRGWSGGTPVEYSSVSTSGIYVKALTYGRGTTPATATISMSDGGTNTLQSFSIKFS